MSRKGLSAFLVVAAVGAALWYFLLRKAPTGKQNTSPLTPRPELDNSLSPTRPAGSTNARQQAQLWSLLGGRVTGSGAGGIGGSGTTVVAGVDLTPFVTAGANLVTRAAGATVDWVSSWFRSSPTTTTTPYRGTPTTETPYYVGAPDTSSGSPLDPGPSYTNDYPDFGTIPGAERGPDSAAKIARPAKQLPRRASAPKEKIKAAVVAKVHKVK